MSVWDLRDDDDLIYVLWDERNERQRNRLANLDAWQNNGETLPLVTSEAYLTLRVRIHISGRRTLVSGQPLHLRIDHMKIGPGVRRRRNP